MISVIIPTYKNPEYLDICLSSCISGSKLDTTRIIVVVDGYIELSQKILDTYNESISVLDLDVNRGMDAAINLGVWNCDSDKVFVVNDDQIFADGWDIELDALDVDSTVYTIEQIERNAGIFNFHVANFGDTVDTFDMEKFNEYVNTHSSNKQTDSARIFPFLLSKRWFMTVGGFENYNSPFWTDVDFFLKLELAGLTFKRIYHTMLFHWGSTATKNRKDSESVGFQDGESRAAEQFFYKWGYLPQIGGQNTVNTKYPTHNKTIKGIVYE